ncbi:MAG: carbohydrate-binding domain-containing protein [Lachnospiraceae bacterium]
MNINKSTIMLCICIFSIIVLIGCSSKLESEERFNVEQNNMENSIQTISLETTNDDYYFDWKSQNYTTIDLANGNTTITESGIYKIIGTLSEGSLTVDVDKSSDKETIYLILCNVTISSTQNTPINIMDGKKVVIILESGTENNVLQGHIQTSDQEFPTAAIYSKADMTITGSGILNITTEYNDGITSKDDLVITEGILNIHAVGDGIVGKDLLAIETATINIVSGKDGLRSTNTTEADLGNIIISSGSFIIDAANDAIQAENVLQINNGQFDLKSGNGFTGVIESSNSFNGGRGMQPNSIVSTASTDNAETESQKALKAGANLVISDGVFNISAYDDAIHANYNVTIEGGTFNIEAGDDAIHADNNVTIYNGTITITNCNEGIEGGTEVLISNGTLHITSSDDGLNASEQGGTITIEGGNIYIKAGGDGIDSNGNIIFSGGNITFDTSIMSADNTSFDSSGTITHTGGEAYDQNGNTIDPTSSSRMGGGFGRKEEIEGNTIERELPEGTRPQGTKPGARIQ